MNNATPEIPVVSVVMPVKNAEKTIKESIDSILNQTLKNFEFIIVNDGSTDGTKDILDSYTANDPRIKVIDSTGKGISEAANCGIEQANAPLIARMDSDDISRPQRLEKQVNAFEENSKLVLLGTFCHTFKDDEDESEIEENKIPLTNAELQKSIRSIPTLTHPTTMARKDMIQRVGGYRKKFEGAEDHDLYLRLSRQGEIAVLPEFLVWYRAHPSQFSQVKKALGFRASVAAIFCDMCDQQSLPDPSEFGKSCDEIALELLFHESRNVTKMSKSQLILCSRAIRGLAMVPNFHHQLISVRRDILIKLVKSGQLHAAFSLWRRSRKKNWLK